MMDRQARWLGLGRHGARTQGGQAGSAYQTTRQRRLTAHCQQLVAL